MSTINRISILEFVALLAFWFALSGRLDPLFVVIGVTTSGVVTAVTRHLTIEAFRRDGPSISIPRHLLALARAIAFAGWLIGRIVLASVQIAWLAIQPRAPVDPHWITFQTTFRSPLARTVLANSISLVPGTLTTEIRGNEMRVHALSPAQASDLLSGRLQNLVAGMFLEDPQPAIDPSAVERVDLS